MLPTNSVLIHGRSKQVSYVICIAYMNVANHCISQHFFLAHNQMLANRLTPETLDLVTLIL